MSVHEQRIAFARGTDGVAATPLFPPLMHAQEQGSTSVCGATFAPDITPTSPPTYVYVSDSYVWVRVMRHAAVKAKLTRQTVPIDPRARVDTGKMIKTLLALSQPFPPFSHVTINLYGVGAPRTDSVWTDTSEYAVYPRVRPPRTEDEIIGVRRVEPDLVSDACFVVGQASQLCAVGTCPGRMIFVTGDADISSAVDCAVKNRWVVVLCAPMGSPAWHAYSGSPHVRLVSLDDVIANCTVTHYQLSPGALPLPASLAFEAEGPVVDRCDAVAEALSRCTGFPWATRCAPCMRRNGTYAIMAVALVPPFAHDVTAVASALVNRDGDARCASMSMHESWAKRLFARDGSSGAAAAPDASGSHSLMSSPDEIIRFVGLELERQKRLVGDAVHGTLPSAEEAYLIAAGLKGIRPWWVAPARAPDSDCARFSAEPRVQQHDHSQGSSQRPRSCVEDSRSPVSDSDHAAACRQSASVQARYVDPVSGGPAGLPTNEYRNEVTAAHISRSTYHDAYGEHTHVPSLCVPHVPASSAQRIANTDPYTSTFLCAGGVGLTQDCIANIAPGLRPPLVCEMATRTHLGGEDGVGAGVENDEGSIPETAARGHPATRCWHQFRCTYGMACRYAHTVEEIRFFAARSVAESLGWSFVPDMAALTMVPEGAAQIAPHRNDAVVDARSRHGHDLTSSIQLERHHYNAHAGTDHAPVRFRSRGGGRGGRPRVSSKFGKHRSAVPAVHASLNC